MRYLAIDYGKKRTGLAICDQTEKISSPLKVIEGSGVVLSKIKRIVEDEAIEAIVLGLPLNMDGSQGFQAKDTLRFAEELKKHIDLPIHLQDERLSTFSAKEKLIPTELTRQKLKKRLDAVAAAEILQAFLEQKASS